jgi:beta-lactamase superfamily II metal-dependent hydrolase
MSSRTKRLIISIAAIFFVFDALIWYWILSSANNKNPEFYFFDVGQGDSQLIILPGNIKVLIDGGPDSKILNNLSKALAMRDRYIDLVILSHAQIDHFGGLIDVFKNYRVGLFIHNGRRGTTAAYNDLKTILAENKINSLALSEGDKISYQSNIFQVLSPSLQNLRDQELNDLSLVLMFQNNEIKALFTGDIGFNIEKVLSQKYNLDADILKVGHHGSKYSSGAEFLKAVSPLVSIIGVGKNSYGHPTKEVLNRLEKLGFFIFRTDQNGIVKLVSDDKKIKVFSER